MKLCLSTLCLNEMEHLPNLYTQHKDWPGLERWVFVEAVDKVYAQANPDMVRNNLSIDGTSEFLLELSKQDHRVIYLPFGQTNHQDKAEGKCLAKDAALRHFDNIAPDLLIGLDADEFYTHSHQQQLLDLVQANPQYNSYMLGFRHPWRPPSIASQNPFQYEVIGGFWDIKHCHVWKWQPGLYYKDHNCPANPAGVRLNSMYGLFVNNHPQCIHMAFTSSLHTRRAKHEYYKQRGEGSGDRRGWYVRSRRAWELWTPEQPILPHGAIVVPYKGPIPEVFKNTKETK